MGDSNQVDGRGEDDAQAPASAAELEAAGQASMFGDPSPPWKTDEPAAPAAPVASPPAATAAVSSPEQSTAPVAAPAQAQAENAAQPYRVLARKYRPQTFSELIGQDAMVRTLGNAIERGRLAHAFLMTGVRGVGKTSTARLIAKALNCVGPDGQGGPTIDPCGSCEPCRAIAEGRHIDVIEMDAASHTGVDDVREIIEAVRYAAVSARYKIYIIDEVHMLSRNAFNALLKTLEEPPAHVKFLFATTEVDKLPVTVLSRCQRFDLRRIPTELLQTHFAAICRAEGVEADDEALALVASAAEGSVRDGLSILDQAIAHADLDEGGKVSAARVRDMLGLADKGAQRRLFAALLEGEPAVLLDGVEHQYALGVEPLALMRSLMDFAHRTTVAQIGRSGADAATAEERQAIEEWSQRLTAGQLHRLWQLLLKGHEEVRAAPDPLVAAQMALLRVMHAADLPDPGELAKRLEERALTMPAPVEGGASAGVGGGAAAVAAPAPVAIDWAELCDRVEHSSQPLAATLMRMQARVVELSPGVLRFSRDRQFAGVEIVAQIRDGLMAATGTRWLVEELPEGGAPSLVEQEQAAEQAAQAALRSHPLVEAAFEAFPGAELVEEAEVRRAEHPRGSTNAIDGRDAEGRAAGRRKDPAANERCPGEARFS